MGSSIWISETLFGEPYWGLRLYGGIWVYVEVSKTLTEFLRKIEADDHHSLDVDTTSRKIGTYEVVANTIPV